MINSPVKQVLDFPFFFTKEVVRFVAQSHGHLNAGAVSSFWDLSFLHVVLRKGQLITEI